MRRFFAPNIQRGGRIIRAVFGLVMILAGLLIRPYTTWACTALVVFGCFVLFEASRGWCLMRACGFKTRL
jgi:hypothetical protein